MIKLPRESELSSIFEKKMFAVPECSGANVIL